MLRLGKFLVVAKRIDNNTNVFLHLDRDSGWLYWDSSFPESRLVGKSVSEKDVSYVKEYGLDKEVKDIAIKELFAD